MRKIKFLIPIQNPLAEIEKTINDENKTVFQVYYQQYNKNGEILENEFGREPQIKFTKTLLKEHFESFDSLDEAIKMIQKYGYKVNKIL